MLHLDYRRTSNIDWCFKNTWVEHDLPWWMYGSPCNINYKLTIKLIRLKILWFYCHVFIQFCVYKLTVSLYMIKLNIYLLKFKDIYSIFYRSFKVLIFLGINQVYIKWNREISPYTMHKIKMWMQYNMLKLNGDKTELIIFSTRKSVGTFFGQNLHLVIQLSRQDPRSEILVSSLTKLCQCNNKLIPQRNLAVINWDA